MKNQVLLEDDYLSGALKAHISVFIGYYSTERCHESLNNLTPEVVYYYGGQIILNQRQRIKQRTLTERPRLYYKRQAALR